MLWLKSLRYVLPLVLVITAADAEAANEIAIRVGSQFVADESFYGVAESNNFTHGELSYSRSLPLVPGLWAEVAWAFGVSEANLFSSGSTRLSLHQLCVGARYAYPVWPWMLAQARVGLGVTIGRLRVRHQEAEFGDGQAALHGHALVGVEVLWPRRFLFEPEASGVTAGLVIEGGVSFGSDLSFALVPHDEDDDLLRLPIRGPDVGSINTSGGVVRLGAVIRF